MKKLLAIVLTLCMVLSMAACAKEASPPVVLVTEPETTAETAPETTQTPETTLPAAPVNVMVLNGTTGFGMANLMDAAAKGEAAQEYNFAVETDASNIVAALVNGSADIAALPTNAASAVYNKTQGKVQVLALNTLGVLYLVTDGSVEISTMADLEGQTVYAPAQNPSFIFQHIVEANGVENYDYIVINGVLEESIGHLHEVIQSESGFEPTKEDYAIIQNIQSDLKSRLSI